MFFSLNKLCLKQSLLRSPWKKVCRLEKSTPTPLQALLTIIRYGGFLIARPLDPKLSLCFAICICHICIIVIFTNENVFFTRMILHGSFPLGKLDSGQPSMFKDAP